MKYRSGYKYQLAEEEFFQTGIGASVQTTFINLDTYGFLSIKAGYAWDGPSGPTYDSKNSMRASLCHDALYQLMREGNIKQSYRYDADKLLDKILKADGMWKIRRWYWLRGVRWFAGGAADESSIKKVLTAP